MFRNSGAGATVRDRSDRARFAGMKQLLCAVAAVAALASVARADDPKLDVEKYTLPNGLEVILAPDPSVPLVAVNVWYHVGSGNEVPGRADSRTCSST